jgi:hypothetical protein
MRIIPTIEEADAIAAEHLDQAMDRLIEEELENSHETRTEPT